MKAKISRTAALLSFLMLCGCAGNNTPAQVTESTSTEAVTTQSSETSQTTSAETASESSSAATTVSETASATESTTEAAEEADSSISDGYKQAYVLMEVSFSSFCFSIISRSIST